jgi:hypothetical protein
MGVATTGVWEAKPYAVFHFQAGVTLPFRR